MTVILSLQKQNNSLNSIKEIVNLTDASLCKKTIQNALFAVGKTLESDVELWMKNINKSKYLKFDETTYTMYNKQGYVWTCISDNEVFYHADKSRAAAVLDLHFPLGYSCDSYGYAAYNRFKTIQRCWSHICEMPSLNQLMNQKPYCMRNCVCCITMQNKSHCNLMHMYIMIHR